MLLDHRTFQEPAIYPTYYDVCVSPFGLRFFLLHSAVDISRPGQIAAHFN